MTTRSCKNFPPNPPRSAPNSNEGTRFDESRSLARRVHYRLPERTSNDSEAGLVLAEGGAASSTQGGSTMPKPIRSILAAAGLLAVAALAAAGVMVTSGTPAHADCSISGPTSADVNQSFTLCAPTTNSSTYEWIGPGLATTQSGRCVSVSGLDRGGYEFTLIRRVNGTEVERCTRVVNVGGSTGGTASCTITGPETIDAGQSATLCAPQDGLHDYSWTGPNGSISSAACITVTQAGT
jgi:hypothetical protein